MTSPLWPNPAPRGPIQFIRRDGDSRYRGENVYRVGDDSRILRVVDGEPLEDVMNRVYALAKDDVQTAMEKYVEEFYMHYNDHQ